MKRFMLFVQIILLCFACAASAQAITYSLPPEGATATITEQEAIRLAKQAAAQQQVNLPEAQVRETMRMLVQDDPTGRLAWVISFTLMDEIGPSFSASIDAVSGTVLYTTTDMFMDIRSRWEEELQLSEKFWDLERKYVFAHCYKYVEGPESLPSEEDLPLPQAVEIACTELAYSYQVTSEELSACRVGAGFTGTKEPQWAISFFNRETDERVYQVNINSRTGDIIFAFGPEELNREVNPQ